MRFDGKTNKQVARKFSLTELSGVTTPAHKGADVSIFKAEQVNKIEFAEALDRMELGEEINAMFAAIDMRYNALLNAVISIQMDPEEYPDQRGAVMAAVSDFVDSLGAVAAGDIEKQREERRRRRRRRGDKNYAKQDKDDEVASGDTRDERRRRNRRRSRRTDKFKDVDGKRFYADDFAFVGDESRPSTWEGIIKFENGRVNPLGVKQAISKLERGIIDPALTTDAVSKLRLAYREGFGGKPLPDILKIRLDLTETKGKHHV